MQIQFPDYVTKTLNILNAAGYEAYVVGGAVRDLLLGLEPGDYDIATDARNRLRRFFVMPVICWRKSWVKISAWWWL